MRALASTLLSFPLFLLTACEKGQDALSAQEREDLMYRYRDFLTADASPFPTAECRAVIGDYADHRNASFVSPDRHLSLLHLACYIGDETLAESLLKAGADPNARTEYGLRPLYCALMADEDEAEAEQSETQTKERMIGILLSHGADLNAPVARHPETQQPLTMLQCIPYTDYPTESLFLSLLEKGAATDNPVEPASFTAARLLFSSEVLPKLIADGAPLSNDRENALHHLCASGMYCADDWEHTVELLLNAGVDVNAANAEGCTPLFLYCRCILEQGMIEGDAAAVSYLLSKGADASLPCTGEGYYHGLNAYDLMAAVPALESALKAGGVALPTYTLTLRKGETTGVDIRKAVLRRHDLSAEQLLPYAELLEASMAAPTDRDNGPSEALQLLAIADKQRAAAAASKLPFFLAPTEGDGEGARNVIYVLRSDADLILPKEMLLRSTDILLKAKIYPRAAAMVELLGRCADAEDDLTRLAEGDNTVTRVAANTVLLLRDGLPCGKDTGVQEWMSEQHLTWQAAPSEIRHAYYLTSLQRFLDGRMAGTVRADFLSVLEEEGLSELADQCRRYDDDSLSDEQRCAARQRISELSWPLEDKADCYIRQHADAFRKVAAAAENPS